MLNNGDYKLGFPVLSEEEIRAVLYAEEKFKDETRTHEIIDEKEAMNIFSELVSEYAERNKAYLTRKQEEYLTKIAFLHTCKFAFLSLLLDDKEIEEISIIGPNIPAYVFLRDNGWKTTNACFESEQGISEIINKMASEAGRRITLQNPRLSAVLPDGSRLHASLPPVSKGEITIRKFRERPFSPKELCEHGTVSPEAIALLSLIMQGDFSVAIAGNTASGKTTTLNSLFSFVPANERIIITEETPEINIPHPHQLRLVANSDMNIDLKDLVYDSLRMRPDRMIVGEVRNQEEIEALFDVLLGGQARGTYATFHAQSAEEGMQRIRSFGINENDLNSLDLIVVQRRMLKYNTKTGSGKEIRRIIEICEIEGGNPSPLFAYDARTDRLESRVSISGKRAGRHGGTGILERLADDLRLSKKELCIEIEKRKKLIKDSENDFHTAFRRIQKQLFNIDAPDVGNRTKHDHTTQDEDEDEDY